MPNSYESLLATNLLGFLQVAKLGSITLAAQAMHLSQPAVTKQLRALEDALGCALVERSGRGVRLTRAGEALADFGRRGASLFDECARALAELISPEAGKLVIGAGLTTSAVQLPTWLGQLRKERPRVDITVRTGTSRVVEQWVLDREVDIGFITTATPSHDLRSRVLFREDIVFVGAPNHRSQRLELESASLILFPAATGFRAYLERNFGSERLNARVKMEIDSVEAIKGFVAAGLGESFLPLSSVVRELATGKLKKLSLTPAHPRLRRSTSLIVRRDREVSLAGRHLLRVIASEKRG